MLKIFVAGVVEDNYSHSLKISCFRISTSQIKVRQVTAYHALRPTIDKVSKAPARNTDGADILYSKK